MFYIDIIVTIFNGLHYCSPNFQIRIFYYSTLDGVKKKTTIDGVISCYASTGAWRHFPYI